MNARVDKKIILTIIVSALGYFVDIYDLILFSIVRVSSLKELGLSDVEVFDKGLLLLNIQMIGMLLGGIFFGILGDKIGRQKVLYGSIILYSLANFLNGFIVDVNQYAFLRFVAGFGLSGELGAGITLVSELMPRQKRGYGTTIVTSIGVSGAMFAWLISEAFLWRTAYMIGGVMGLSLLLLRVGVLESDLFLNTKNDKLIKRGHLKIIFLNLKRFKKFISCVFIGVPIWYVVGILMTLAPEFSTSIGIIDKASAGKSVFYCYAGLTVGDVLSGLLSQYLKSRKKCILIFQLSMSSFILIFFFKGSFTTNSFYLLCFLLGISIGYWAILVTIAAEQFGTNIRATVATTVPNFVRGSLVVTSLMFSSLKGFRGIHEAGMIVGFLVILISLVGLNFLDETFSRDLNFLEQDN